MDGRSPTPVTEFDAVSDVIEEIADVYLCLTVLDFNGDDIIDEVSEIAGKKLARWVKRLKERDSYGSERVSESAEETGLADSEQTD